MCSSETVSSTSRSASSDRLLDRVGPAPLAVAPRHVKGAQRTGGDADVARVEVAVDVVEAAVAVEPLAHEIGEPADPEEVGGGRGRDRELAVEAAASEHGLGDRAEVRVAEPELVHGWRHGTSGAIIFEMCSLFNRRGHPGARTVLAFSADVVDRSVVRRLLRHELVRMRAAHPDGACGRRPDKQRPRQVTRRRGLCPHAPIAAAARTGTARSTGTRAPSAGAAPSPPRATATTGRAASGRASRSAPSGTASPPCGSPTAGC